VREAVEASDAPAVKALVGDLHESDVGALIEALDPELRPRLVELMAATSTSRHSPRSTIRSVRRSSTSCVRGGGRGRTRARSDDAVAILEDLTKAEQAEILEQLSAPERVALARSLDYPEHSAGRRMQTELIVVEPHWTVGQTIDYMRETPDLPDRFWQLYAVDAGRKLKGVVALDRLLRTKRPVRSPG